MNNSPKTRTLLWYVSLIVVSFYTFSCSESKGESDVKMSDTGKSYTGNDGSGAKIDLKAFYDKDGTGEYKNVSATPVDAAMAAEGGAIFKSKCSSCHKTSEQKLLGPGLKGVTKRRTHAWILNMITVPDIMLREDELAKALHEEYNSNMLNMSISDKDARQILEFLKKNDE